MKRISWAILLVVLDACSCGQGTVRGGTDGGCNGGACASDGGGGGPDGSVSDGGGPTGTLSIQPATSTLAVNNGVPASVQLQALLTNSGGVSVVEPAWSSSRPDIAAVSPSGVVTAQGPLGGVVTINAAYFGASAAAQVQVVVSQTVFSGADGGTASLFSNPPQSDPQHSPAVIYPYDQVVIPVNLQPLDFQWRPGTGNDTFRVTLTGPNGKIVAYLQPANLSQPSWQPDPSVWTPFAQANIGQKVSLDLAGAASAAPGAVYGAATQTLTLAASRFAGTIYYWTVTSPGQVLRVSAGSAAPQPVYTPPIGGPNNTQCMGCHSVSRDGKRLSAQVWEAAAPNAGTVLDVTQAPAVPVVDGGLFSWRFSTFDDTGHLLVTSWDGSLTLRSADTGDPVPGGSGEANLGSIGCAAGSTCTHPSWSPDGTNLFFSKGLAGHFSYDVDFEQADLLASSWNPTAQTFSAPSTLVAYNYDGNALANFHPSVSIDNQWVAFNRGPCSRSDGTPSCAYTCGGSTCMPASLMLVSANGGTPIELKRAESPDTRNWFPNFSPFKEGGYHWLAFFSERDYGWVTAGQNLRQIWVTAIDDPASAGSDPSHPAFWLPGQESTTVNDKAEWAPLPCVGQGQGCQGDIDCCSGLACRYEADGGESVCIPASQACGFPGATCTKDSDCCTGLTCQGGFCNALIQ